MNAFKYPAPVALAMSTLAHAGDPCAATVVTGGTYAFSTVAETDSGITPSDSFCTGTYLDWGGPDTWFQIEATQDGILTASTCNIGGYDTSLAAWSGSCDDLTQIGCNGDAAGCSGFTSEMSVTVEAGNTYFIQIGGYQGDTGSGEISINIAADPCDRDPLVFNVVSAADFINQIGPGLADLCPGDIINWGPGVYNWGYTISLAANGVIHRGSVDANGNPTTIITGDNQRRCLTFFGVEVYENMIFEDGVASGDGGAFILNPGFGKVTFRNCVFRNNTASSLGGAVCNLGAQLGSEFIDCLFIGNSGNDAGACIALQNGADGAIFTNCEFVNNTANNTGGAICTAGGSPTAIGCIFRNNNAANGGGIYINGSDTATVGNSTLCGNSPNQYAGPGVFNDQGGNEISASCDANDCNGNGIPDADEIAGGADDCDANGVLDECEAFGGDCDGNGVLDVCETLPDCDADGVSDCEAIAGGATDCDQDGVPDSCTGGPGIPDTIADAEPMDANSTVTGSTECANEEATWTCSGNVFTGVGPDVFYSLSLAEGGTLLLDLCNSGYDTDVSIHDTAGNILYCDGDSAPTSEGCTQYASRLLVSGIDAGEYIIRIGGWNGDSGTYEMVSTFEAIVDCNGNGVADESDIANGTSDDINSNDIPDECEACVLPAPAACSGDGVVWPAPTGAATGTGIACPSGLDTYLNPYNAADIASGDLMMSCVEVGIGNLDTGSLRYGVSILAQDLTPLSESVEFCQESNAVSTVSVAFAEPVMIPAGSTFWVAVTRESPAAGFASFATTEAATVSETHVLSETCGLAAPTSLDDIGFPGFDMGVAMTFVDSDEPCTGDLDGDGNVGFSDLQLILSAWNNGDGGDANGDGETNFSDLQVILSAWGGC